MQDLETKTIWSQVTGEALEGELVGFQLNVIPAVQTTWSKWFAEHPNTKLLKKPDQIVNSNYAGYFKDPKRTGLFRGEWLTNRMPGKTLVYGIRYGNEAVAVTAELLEDGEYHRIQLDGHEILVGRTADGGVRAWILREKGKKRALDVLEIYWFAWSAFYPHTAVADSKE